MYRLVSAAPAAPALGGPSLTLVSALRVAVILLASANLGNVPLFDLGGRSAPLFLSDMGTIAVVLTGAVAMTQAGRLRLDAITLAALTFIAVGGLSAIAAMPRFGLDAFQVAASLAYLARWAVYLALYVVIINCVHERHVMPLWQALEGTILVFAAFGIFQSIFLPDFGPMIRPDAKLYAQIDPQGHRLVSTVLEPNIAAAMILIVLLVQIGQLAAGAQVRYWKPAILFAALVLTMSRSGALGFFVAVLVIMSATGLRKRLLRFGGVAMILGLAALPSVVAFAQKHGRFGISDGSAAARLIAWQRALTTWAESPWFGIGFNTYGFVQERRGFERVGAASYSAEGGLLFVAVLTGIVGLAVYGCMLWFVIRKCRSAWRHPAATPAERGLCVGAAAATVAILVHSTFVNSLLVNFVMQELWIVWGLVFLTATAIHRRYRDEALAA